MGYNLKSEEDVKQYLKNLGTEYRFGCLSEKNPEVCHLLGDFLEAIKKDYKKARKIYRTNCDDHGFAKSCFKYGNYLALGKGEEKPDIAGAMRYFEQACDGNEYRACFQQGILLVSDLSNYGIKRDVKKGAALLEKACEGKNDAACFHAFGVYIEGLKKPGVDKKGENQSLYEIEKDKEKAFRYAKEGCELGNMYCCANLSQMYRRGDGIKKDDELAEKYKKIASEMQNELQMNKSLNFQQGIEQ